MKRTLVCMVVFVAFYVPVAAADAPTPSHREAAAELLRSIDLETTMLGGAAAMADAMVERNPMLGPYRDVLLAWASKFMNWETFGPGMIDLYVEAFTESELREMNVFYGTPTGRKSIAVMPELMRRGAALGAEVASAHQAELEKMIRQRARELEEQVREP